jgi:hypothetical protein
VKLAVLASASLVVSKEEVGVGLDSRLTTLRQLFGIGKENNTFPPLLTVLKEEEAVVLD